MPTRSRDTATRRLPSRKSHAALLLIDVINDLDFEEVDEFLKQALPMARRLADLKRRASRAGIPCIYVNDNFDQWKSDFRHTIEHCERSRHGQVARLLRPRSSDYFVLKPKHSGFYATTLDLLLEYLATRSLIITGIAANICVLFTANDAYMRDYRIHVPADCVASNTAADTQYSLRQMRDILKADTRDSRQIELGRLVARGRNQNSRTPRRLLAAQ
jgi:nicotinamidase-related amidase